VGADQGGQRGCGQQRRVAVEHQHLTRWRQLRHGAGDGVAGAELLGLDRGADLAQPEAADGRRDLVGATADHDHGRVGAQRGRGGQDVPQQGAAGDSVQRLGHL
jgi:hypothetical protein